MIHQEILVKEHFYLQITWTSLIACSTIFVMLRPIRYLADQTLIAKLLAEHGRTGFARARLAARGAGWAIDLIPTLDLETFP